MARIKRSAKLSVGEMRLIAVLWRMGPLKLAEAYREQPGQVGYTTIQTQLNRLVDKGVVARSETRPTKYRAIVDPDAASSGMLQMLVDTVGGGSPIPVIELLVHHSPLTKEVAKQLKQFIDDAVKNPKAKSKKAASKRKTAV